MVSSNNNKLENDGEFTESDNPASSENRATLKVLKKIATQDTKQEINLPKGRLLLFKSNKEYENEYIKNNMLGKSYSKKWLDDISDNLCLSPMQLLKDNFDEDVGCLLEEPTQSVKVGKSTNDLVNGLLYNKFGKDRYMQKVPYMEYMPHDFGSKMSDNLKPATPSINRMGSRMTSAFSFTQDDIINSEDYMEETEPRAKRTLSRLSGQPVLSTRHLISRLSCKNDFEDIEANVPDINLDEPNVFTNYKETFLIDELTKRSSISSSSTSSMQTEEQQQDASFRIHVESSSFENGKKILKKRPNIENNKIEHHHYHPQPQQEVKVASMLNETKHTTSTEDLAQEEHKLPISIEIREERADELRPESANQSENLPNLKSYRSFNSSLQQRYQQRLLLSRLGSYPQSATESPTNIIRIRRVFDGETLKINQMNLNPNETRPEQMKYATERNVKSANASQIKWRPKRLIKSADQRTRVENDFDANEIVTNLVESLVTNTTTKTPSDTINESIYLRDALFFKKGLKQETKTPVSATQQRNTAKQGNNQAGATANTRKTKSAGSKVRFNENLLQNQFDLRVLLQSAGKKVDEKSLDDKQKEKSDEISNLAISESIVESKIIEIKEVSNEKLATFDDATTNEPDKYQKSMSPSSFTEEIKSYPMMSSQDREQIDNEEEEEIINDVATANLDTRNETKPEIENESIKAGEEEIEQEQQEVATQIDEGKTVEKIETESNKEEEKHELVLEPQEHQSNLSTEIKQLDQDQEEQRGSEEQISSFAEEKNKIEIYLQKHELIEESDNSKDFLHDLHEHSANIQNENGDFLITEYLKKPFKKVEISNIVVERTISDTFLIESVAKLVEIDTANQANTTEEEDAEEDIKHEVTIIKPAPESPPNEALYTAHTENRRDSATREMPRVVTKLPPAKSGKKMSSKKSKKHKVQVVNYNETNVLDDEQLEIVKEKKRQLLLKIEQMKAQLDPKHVYPKYTYLQIPYQYQDPVVDHGEFAKAFHIPEKICPQIHKIDPRTTSIEQLDLEKRIMEERIRDLFIKKTAAFNSGILVNEAKKKTLKKKAKAKEPKSDDLAVKKEKKVKEIKPLKEPSKEFKEVKEQTEETKETSSLEKTVDDSSIVDPSSTIEPSSTLDPSSIISEEEKNKETHKEHKESLRKESKDLKESKDPKDQKHVKTLKDDKEHKEHKGSKEKEPKKDKKEALPKSKLNQDERMRLYNEALNKQIERDNVYNLILKNITDKEEEIEQLNEELEKNNYEFEARLKLICDQLAEIETDKNDVLELLSKSKAEYLEKLNVKFENERKYQRIRFEELKEEKLKEMEFKKKECEFIASIYNDPADKAKALKRVEDVESNHEKWLASFEIRMAKEEHELDDKLNIEEDSFISLQHDEEERALKPFYEENMRCINEKNDLEENFNDMKSKITTRIDALKEEIAALKAEKSTIEETTERNIQLQTAKLNELLQIEREAKEKIKGELENYRLSIMKIREKNLKMKYDLSMLKHCHGITKPYVFSFYSEFPNYEKSETTQSNQTFVAVKTTAKK